MARPVVRTHRRNEAPERASLECGLRVTEGALAAHAKRTQVHPVDLRQGLALAFSYAIRSAFDSDVDLCGEVMIGLGNGPRRKVVLGGLHLSVCLADPPLVSPFAVTVLHRHDGVVHLSHDVEFGNPAVLAAAAASRSLPQGSLIGAIEAVVRDLGRLEEPVAPIGAVHLADDAGWEVFRFVQVTDRVHDPRLHIGISAARALEPDSRKGDVLGVSLRKQDWLTPTLCWLGGAG